MSNPNVNPKHYKSHPSGVECIQITRHMGFNLGNVTKYVWRADMKNGLEDLRKAWWYLTDELDMQTEFDAEQRARQILNGTNASEESIKALVSYLEAKER